MASNNKNSVEYSKRGFGIIGDSGTGIRPADRHLGEAVMPLLFVSVAHAHIAVTPLGESRSQLFKGAGLSRVPDH